LQCAQRFPARPADPDSSVFEELFPVPQPEPSQPNVPTEKAKQIHINWNPLGFLSDLSTHKNLTRFPPNVRQAFFCTNFGAPIPKMLAHAQSRTLCSCKMGNDSLGDYVLTCKQHTGSIRKQGDVGIFNFPISLRDGLVIDVPFVSEFKGSSHAPGGWNNSVRHTNDILQARAKVLVVTPAMQ